jgi:aminoglycoside phosphotransferase (APT) family kinase protein
LGSPDIGTEKMHENEILAEPPVVRRLLRDQLPKWAELAISELPLGGTGNALYRLGDDMLVRLPRIDWAVADVGRDHEWLPRLAPFLPVEIPTPLAMGAPGEGYPWPWAVYRWLEGEDPSTNLELDLDSLLPDIVRFIKRLRSIDLPASPRTRSGIPLKPNDESARQKIEVLGDRIDRKAALALWEEALASPEWEGDPLWVHADLDARNVLVKDGRLNAVIDWGCAGIGDPAFDVAVAWRLFSPGARERFRSELDVDDATWNRARGFVLLQSANALSYYTLETNRALVQESERWIAAVLSSVTES